MISYLRGTLIQRTPTALTLEVSGVGYGVMIPLSVFYRLPPEGEEVEMFIYTHVQKDGIILFGFLSPRERDLFELLLSVRGVGPKVALTLLSGMEAEEIEKALLEGDTSRLERVPGIGRRTAERMVFELRERIINRRKSRLPPHPFFEDALAALIRLGYPKGQAKKALERVARSREAESLEGLLKEALRELYGERG